MKALISLLTAAAVFLHLLLGCCAHHAHAHQVEVRQIAAYDCCAHHSARVKPGPKSHDHSPAWEAPGDEHSGGSCGESECAFGVAGKTLPNPPMANLLAILPPAAHDDLTCRAAQQAHFCLADRMICLPLRAHLLHQVFLN